MDQEIAQQFNRINAKLNKLMEAQKKETWVKVGFVTMLTGWDHEKIRQARDQEIIEWKIDPAKGRLYKLESIPEMFILKTQKSDA